MGQSPEVTVVFWGISIFHVCNASNTLVLPMQEIKVLIISEEREFTDILTDRLRSWGFIANSAGSGDEAMAMITQSRPDVVVLSLRSGHGHDLETLSMIKNMDAAIEVILLTCKGTAIAGMKGIEQGAVDCMHQPIELGVLIEKIRRAHAQRSAPGMRGFGLPLFPSILSCEQVPELLSSLFA
jgi:DNA-binding NtrC family response regulator